MSRRNLGEASLTSVNPELASQWDFEKNAPLTPCTVPASLSSKIWWLCAEGHSWQAAVRLRNEGNRCPFCSGRYLLTGFNDLATRRPEIAASWHPTKNSPLTPSEVQCGSRRRVWWVCSLGHAWATKVSNRTNGSGCPFCSGCYTLSGFNDLATLRPDLVAGWHPTKNEGLLPSDVAPQSNKVVWWQCPRGHEWKMTLARRFHGGWCPQCRKH